MNNLISKDYIVSSPHQDLYFPKCDVWTFLEKALKENKDKIALLDPKEGRSLTFSDTHQLVNAVAANLQELGYKPDKALAIYMTNCIEYVIVSLAVWKLGGFVAVINPLLTVSDITKYLHILKSEYLMCNGVTMSNAVASSVGSTIKAIICKEGHPGCVSFSRLCQPNVKLQNVKTHFINPEKDVSLIAFSSGTTGTPKGVQLSHSALIEQCVYVAEIGGLGKGQNGAVVYQPMSHMYGVVLFVVHIITGQKTIPLAQFDLETYVKYIEKYKFQLLSVVPPIAVLLTKSPLIQKYDISSVKTILSAAAPLRKETETALKEAFNNKVNITQAYGLTECSAAVTFVPHDFQNPPQGSVGWPFPRTSLKVVDLETGKNLGPGKAGELCVKCDYFMLGYLGNPKATAEMIRDGWLHTGDIGYYDKSGCFFIVDRLKELLKYKGLQVSPSELESLILTHPGIADVGVTSIPDHEAGDLPQAWVVPKPGIKLQEIDVQNYVKERVAPFKRLRGGVKFVDAIPKSPSGKIMRRLMKPQTPTQSKL